MRRALRSLAILIGLSLAVAACTMPESSSGGKGARTSFPDWGEVETTGTPMLQDERKR
ncbi:MAG: hypothetical protein ACPG31_08240 [Planctomycetota bacterium]